jgi:hypothetical protein
MGQFCRFNLKLIKSYLFVCVQKPEVKEAADVLTNELKNSPIIDQEHTDTENLDEKTEESPVNNKS